MNAIEKIRKFSEQYMKRHSFSSHDYEHVKRVTSIAKHIGKIEKADLFVLEAAALMHDLARSEEKNNPSIDHAEKSAEIADRFLRKLDLPDEVVGPITYAIKTHRYSSGIAPKTKEAKILQDADKLDGLGAVGIARCFSYGGGHGRAEYDPKDPLCMKKKKYEHEKYSVDHFYQKLFKLKNLMHTRAAKKIAEGREKYMKSFLKQLAQEIEGKK